MNGRFYFLTERDKLYEEIETGREEIIPKGMINFCHYVKPPLTLQFIKERVLDG